MDLNGFLRARQDRWARLTDLLDRVDQVSLVGLSRDEAHELFSLYRLVSSDLNLVQTRTANPALLEYLESLVGRAHANLAVPRRVTLLRSWWQIVRHYFPATIRKEWRLLALAFGAMAAGVLLGFGAALAAPQTAAVFLPPEHLAQSPSARVAELEALERSGASRVPSLGVHSVFSTFLFTHNIRVTVLCFALGVTLGIGTMVMLFFNGAMLGCLAGLYAEDGVMTFFLAWIGPHGSIELPCILLGSTAGLMLARAQLRRSEGSFRSQVRAMRPALVDILVGTSTLLVIAGCVEGGFSQVNEPTLPYPFKIAVAVALGSALVGYLFFMPAKLRPENEE